MSAIKQPQRSQSLSFSTASIDVGLTMQERRALSLVWSDDETDSVVEYQHSEPATEHCAELGYN
jgi:hypothetical protein